MADEGRILFDEALQARRRLRWAAAAGAALALLLYVSGIGAFLDLKLYDFWFGVRGPRDPSPQVVVVAFTEEEVAQYGPPPWPRDVYAPLIRKLKEAGARVIGFDFSFPPNPREEEPSRLAGAPASETAGAGTPPSRNDVFAAAIREAGNVVFDIEFDKVGDTSPPGDEPPAPVAKNAVPRHEELGLHLLRAPVMVPTEPKLAAAAAALGHVNAGPDADGSIQVARLHVRTPLGEVKVEDGLVRLGSYGGIPIPRTGEVLLNWISTDPSLPVRSHSALDVVDGRVLPGNFRGKAVLVAGTAKGLDDRNTPFHKPGPGVIAHATFLDNLFTLNFVRYPTWA
jgi:CHASE2 domain-containing sensor protein